MYDDQIVNVVFQDKKRPRLYLPTKTAPGPLSAPGSALGSSPAPILAPTGVRYDRNHWKKSARVAAQILPSTSRAPAHKPVNGNTSNGVDMAVVKTNDIQANKPSVIKTNPNVIERRELKRDEHSPMKFDQQTQTRTTMQNFGENSDTHGIMLQQEIISEQVCAMAEENQDLRKQITTMQNDIQKIATNMESMHSALFKMCDFLQVPNYDKPLTIRTIVKETQQGPTDPPRILNLTNPLNSTPQPISYSSMSIEPMIEASNDSIQSYSNQSYVSPGASFQSIYQFESSNTSDSSFNSTMKSRNNNTHRNKKMETEEVEIHPDDIGDPNDDVILGNNKTTVIRSVLLNINWKSHTSATRHLLRTKFSREILATHSLTGKPSPAFIDSNKPIKHQLDEGIVDDIVKYVSERCKVTGTAVRSAITTKCADENKMMRQRMEKERRQSVKIEPNEDKENSENKQIKNKRQESVQVNKPEAILKPNNKMPTISI